MQWLAELSVRRPVFATVLILSLTVIGVFSFTRLGVDQFPKVDLPMIVITTVCFVLAMLCLITGLLSFLREVQLAINSLRIGPHGVSRLPRR